MAWISFGRFKNNHKYIIYSIIGLIAKDIISGYNYNDCFKQVIPINHSREYFAEHHLINHFFCYTGKLILSIIFHLKEKKILQKLKKNQKKKKKN